MAKINYPTKNQSVPYKATKWNAQDANEVKVSVNSLYDDVSDLSETVGGLIETTDTLTENTNDISDGLSALYGTVTTLSTSLDDIKDGDLGGASYRGISGEVSQVSTSAAQITNIFYSNFELGNTTTNPLAKSISIGRLSTGQFRLTITSNEDYPIDIDKADLKFNDGRVRIVNKINTSDTGVQSISFDFNNYNVAGELVDGISFLSFDLKVYN